MYHQNSDVKSCQSHVVSGGCFYSNAGMQNMGANTGVA